MINLQQSKAMIGIIQSTLDWLKEKEEYSQSMSKNYFDQMKEIEASSDDDVRNKHEKKFSLEMSEQYDADKKACQELQAFIIDNYRTLI